MDSEVPRLPDWPKIDVLPLVDRVVDAGLWVGRLLTRQFGHNPATHGDHFQDLLDYPDHTGELPEV